MPAVFISYSRRDKDFVAKLHDALQARQYDVWVDWQDIPPVAEWFEEIRTGVGSADGFVYVISPESVDSEICQRELEHAVAQHKRIVPIVRREPDSASVPKAAAELNWIFLRDGDNFDDGLEQLVGAIEKDIEHVRTHTRLGIAANRWQSSGRESSQLLRGAELAAAESWLVAGADKQPEPTQLQREYVLAGRQAATRRQRAVIGAITIAFAITAVLAVVALIERSSAISARNVAVVRQLDANAQSVYPTDPELSVLLATRAAQLDPGTPTEQALREALAQSNIRVRYTLSSPEPGDALWSPDGTRLLVTDPGPGGWARIYTPLSDAAPVVLGSVPAVAGQSAWDARGDRVLIGGHDPAVYDARTGRLVARLPYTALYGALNADGTRAVTVDVNSVGHVFAIPGGHQVAAFHPGPNGGSTCMALSPDGTAVAQCELQPLSGHGHDAVDTWSTITGRLLHSVASPSVIGSVAFSPDSSEYVFTTPNALAPGTVATATQLARAVGLDGTFVYGTQSGRLVMAFRGPASTAAFGPIATLPTVAYATIDGLGHVYSFLSDVNTPLAGSTDVVNTISFNSAGTEVVEGSRDDVARVFDASTGGLPIETLAGHEGEVTSAAFGLGGTAIATASKDGTVRVWTTTTPRPSAQLAASELPHHGDGLTASVAFTADSRRIVQASETGEGQVLDARDLKVLTRFAAPAGQGFAGAAANRNGALVAALSGPITRHAGLDFVTSVVQAELYDAADGRLLETLKPVSAPALFDAALDYTGARLVTVGSDGSADVWDTRTGRLLSHIPGSTPASAAVFSHDGSLLAVVRYPKLPPPSKVNFDTVFGPVTISLYDARNGHLQRTITGYPLVAQEQGTTMYASLSVALSPDGSLVAVGGADQGVEVYDTASGRLVAPLGITSAAGGNYAFSLAFSPDGKLLAAGAVSGTYVWHVPSFAPYPQVFVQVPAGNTNGIAGDGTGHGVVVGFTENSQYMLTAGDNTVIAWDPADHLQLFHSAGLVEHANLSPSGASVVTVSPSGIALFPCDLCTGLPGLLALARRDTMRRTFTPGERATYLNQG